jgi:hypothetical protein
MPVQISARLDTEESCPDRQGHAALSVGRGWADVARDPGLLAAGYLQTPSPSHRVLNSQIWANAVPLRQRIECRCGGQCERGTAPEAS